MPNAAAPADLEQLPDPIGALVRRLARPHVSGGMVIERSVIIAEGARSAAILGWITDHDGVADATAVSSPSAGLHGPKLSGGAPGRDAPARRFVLPAHAFD